MKVATIQDLYGVVHIRDRKLDEDMGLAGFVDMQSELCRLGGTADVLQHIHDPQEGGDGDDSSGFQSNAEPTGITAVKNVFEELPSGRVVEGFAGVEFHGSLDGLNGIVMEKGAGVRRLDAWRCIERPVAGIAKAIVRAHVGKVWVFHCLRDDFTRCIGKVLNACIKVEVGTCGNVGACIGMTGTAFACLLGAVIGIGGDEEVPAVGYDRIRKGNGIDIRVCCTAQE